MARRQRRLLREVLVLLHRRDEHLGFLPAVDRGPPRGLLDASCDAVCDGAPLPDLRQLPPNLFYAARAVQLLAGHELTAGQVDDWLARNLRAAREPLPEEVAAALPMTGCRSHEDVRNRILVGIEDLTVDELEHFDRVLSAAREGHGPRGSA